MFGVGMLWNWWIFMLSVPVEWSTPVTNVDRQLSDLSACSPAGQIRLITTNKDKEECSLPSLCLLLALSRSLHYVKKKPPNVTDGLLGGSKKGQLLLKELSEVMRLFTALCSQPLWCPVSLPSAGCLHHPLVVVPVPVLNRRISWQQQLLTVSVNLPLIQVSVSSISLSECVP